MKPYLVQYLLDASAERVPSKIAVSDRGRTVTYGELAENSRKVAAMLVSLGIRPGEHVGIWLDKSIEQVEAVFGVLYAGGVVVIINPILKLDQIAYILRDCEIRTLIGTGPRIKKDIQAFHGSGVNRVLNFHPEPSGFDREIRTTEDAEPHQTDSRAILDDPSHIIYTSGSTGMPKGIVVTHRNTIDGAKIVSQYTGLTKDDRIAGVMPFNFDYGYNQLMNTMLLGATIILHQFFMPNDLLNLIESEHITMLGGMPPIWTKLFNPKLTDLDKPRDLSALRVLTNTGGKVPVPIVRKLREHFPQAKLFLMYGLTEAFRSTYLDPAEVDKRPESIGKAIPNCDVFVVNAEGKECGPGEEGELIHRGALITQGYWNDPEKTAKVFRPNPLLDERNRHLETVVYSGDIVKKDKEGFLYYVGRRDAMIKTKGYRVSPTEVEELMLGIDGVAECVAAGFERDDEILLRAFVVVKSYQTTVESIVQTAKQRFPFYLMPDDLVILDKFPLTANGKIDRTLLVHEYDSKS
jgi:acyl-CoA ligase (AMP-forming) (exosortase A-associated)